MKMKSIIVLVVFMLASLGNLAYGWGVASPGGTLEILPGYTGEPEWFSIQNHVGTDDILVRVEMTLGGEVATLLDADPNGFAWYNVPAGTDDGFYIRLRVHIPLECEWFYQIRLECVNCPPVDPNNGGIPFCIAIGANAGLDVLKPRITIEDVSLEEGDAGARPFHLMLGLSHMLGRAVTVDYTTEDASATLVDNDYELTSGTVVFAPNDISESITVPVNGDIVGEANEAFFVRLSNPTNATIEDNEAIGIILNDDGPASRVSIDDVSLTEGDEDITLFVFSVNVVRENTQEVSVDYTTKDRLATVADYDYEPVSGTLVFGPNETTQLISVPVYGDTQAELHETFSVCLGSPTNSMLEDGEALGTILDDDNGVYEGELIVITGGGGAVNHYDIATGSDNGILIQDFHYSFGGLTLGPDGSIYASTSNDDVVRFDRMTGQVLGTFVVSGSGGLRDPAELVFGPDGNLYVVSNWRASVLRYDGDTGEFIDEFVSEGSGGLSWPRGLTFGPDGYLYLCSPVAGQVLKYSGTTGEFLGVFAHADYPIYPVYLSFGPDGNLYVSDLWGGEVLRYNGATGELMDSFIPPECGLNEPQGLVFSPDGWLYVAGGSSNNVVRSNGERCDVFATVSVPTGLAIGLPWGLEGDFDFDRDVDFYDFGIFAEHWQQNNTDPDWREDCDLDSSKHIYLGDVALFADHWLEFEPEDPCNLVWVYIDDPGFNGEMSKYETTNAQYCEFLNDALASRDIYVSGNIVYGSNGFNSGVDFVGEVYFDTYAASSYSQITYSGGVFSVLSRDGYNMSNHPVVEVTWYGAMAFCNYYGYRLPTEWEWQAVADYNGTYTYGCGTSLDPNKANYGEDNPLGLSSWPYTTPVDYYPSYGYGMNDMAGNAWEWTSSCYYACNPDDYRVVRGGAWYYAEYNCPVSRRYHYAPDYTYGNFGFRVCR